MTEFGAGDTGARGRWSAVAGRGLAVLLAVTLSLGLLRASPTQACGPEWSPPIPIDETFPYRVLAPESTHRRYREEIIWAAAAPVVSNPSAVPRDSQMLKAMRAAQQQRSEAHQQRVDAYASKVARLAEDSGVELSLPTPGCPWLPAEDLAPMEVFFDAVAADPGLADHPEERARLVSLRHEIYRISARSRDQGVLDELAARIDAARSTSPEMEALGGYLAATHAFYRLDYESAEKIFRELADSGSQWVAETALYMVARTRLREAQTRWTPRRHGLSEEERREHAARRRAGILAARETFGSYLARYPEGRYARSARGLDRFMHKLLGERAELDAALRALFARIADDGSSLPTEERQERFLEIMRHYEGTQAVRYETPLLLLVALLKAQDLTPFSLEAIEAERDAYAGLPGLFDYVRSLYLWRSQQMERLAALELVEPGPGILQAATLATRARGLERLERFAEAADLWRRLLPGTSQVYERFFVQAQVIENYIRDGRGVEGFQDSSLEIEPKLRQNVMNGVLGRKDLEALWQGPSVDPEVRHDAAHALMRLLLIQGEYAAFLEVYAATEERGVMTQVETAARTLARKPDDPKGLLNAGYFLAHYGLRPHIWTPMTLDSDVPAREREDGRPLRQPFDYYKAIIDMSENAAPSETEAKALHYAIQCFRQGYGAGNCWWGGGRASNETKAWFVRLHEKYPDSRWTKRTPYYY